MLAAFAIADAAAAAPVTAVVNGGGGVLLLPLISAAAGAGQSLTAAVQVRGPGEISPPSATMLGTGTLPHARCPNKVVVDDKVGGALPAWPGDPMPPVARGMARPEAAAPGGATIAATPIGIPPVGVFCVGFVGVADGLAVGSELAVLSANLAEITLAALSRCSRSAAIM